MQHKILSNNPTRMQIKKIKKKYKTWIEITANDVCVCLLMNAVHLTVHCNDAEKKKVLKTKTDCNKSKHGINDKFLESEAFASEN